VFLQFGVYFGRKEAEFAKCFYIIPEKQELSGIAEKPSEL